MDGERRSLVGQVAVITAAAGAGIGGAIARRFLADGATVIASDVHERRLMILHEQTGAEVEVVDVGAPGAVEKHLNRVLSVHGRVDVMVNCAGINSIVPAWEITDESWQRIFDVNVTSILRACRAVVPAMLRRRYGSIINIASAGAWQPNPGESAYSASKAAVIAFTRGLAIELAEYGIRANAIAPGLVEHEALVRVYPAERVAALRARTPFGRGAAPAEVAGVASWLASEDSSFVTGETIGVTGGGYLRP